ncbi:MULTISPECIES: FusB/FusC family EF-G-binding protein [unclassified Exiguobacterium]|uniref:FusB/FusC family EF-G-binding protein n=1 Tax=unclassified Exiguobacterium TaxID=2644629 RepID=UPI001BEAD18D|nr:MULTISPECIES: FusB/FusC family EF-G-binding protein [unclassified Exiguobacterium]
MQPFIKPHQYNFIRNQIELLLQQLTTVNDPDVRDAVLYSATTKIFDIIPILSPEQEELLMTIRNQASEQQLFTYLDQIQPFVEPFPTITPAEIQALFPKVKKLHLPPLDTIDFLMTTYLSWNDTSNKKKFFVYPLDGTWIGLESTYLPNIQHGICSLCKTNNEVALVSVRTNKSADHYRAVGNYLCIDSDQCNASITAISDLEKFLTNAK